MPGRILIVELIVDGFIPKPIEKAVLLREIRRFLQG